MRYIFTLFLLTIGCSSYASDIQAQLGLGMYRQQTFEKSNPFFAHVGAIIPIGQPQHTLSPEFGYMMKEELQSMKRQQYYFQLNYGYQFHPNIRSLIGIASLHRTITGNGDAPYSSGPNIIFHPRKSRKGMVYTLNLGAEAFTDKYFGRIEIQSLEIINSKTRRFNVALSFGVLL